MNLPIKYKLFLLTLIISLVGLISYARFSDNIFRNDKEAYVYGDGITQTKSLIAVVESLNENVETVLRFITKNGGPVPATIKRVKELFPRVGEVTWIPGKKNEKGNWHYVLRTDGHLGVEAPFGPLGMLNFELKADDLVELFKSNKGVSTFLLDKNLNLVAGDAEAWKDMAAEHQDLAGKITANKLISGNFSHKAKEEDQLIAYSRSQTGDLTVLRTVEKSRAYEALEILEKKSWIFFAVIFFVVMIASLLSAGRITEGLRKLHTASQEVSKGNFNVDVQIKSKDEIGDLAYAFTEMARKVAQLLNELKLHNERLEITVQERTAQLREALNIQKAMVNSLSEGFFVYDIKSRKRLIETQSCLTIFGQDFGEQSLARLLEGSEEEAESLEEVLEGMNEGFMSFKDSVGLLPARRDISGKSIFFHYYPMGAEKKLESLVVQAEDRTKEIEAQEKFEEEVRVAKALSSFIKHRGQVEDFLLAYKEFMAEIKSRPVSPESIKHWQFRAHTLKGNAGVLELHVFARSLHAFEDRLSGEKNIKEGLVSLEKTLIDFSDLVGVVIENENGERKRSVSERAIKKIIQKLEMNNQNDLANEARKEFLSYSVPELFIPIMNNGAHMSLAAGKKAKFTMECPEINAVDERLPKLVENLIHIYRNSLAHGIEFPVERQEEGKPEEGTIHTSINHTGSSLCIKISDDGKGMSTELRSKLLEGTAESTTANLDDLSGRGWGMKAVKEGIEALGGKMNIASTPGKGTTFTFEMEAFKTV